MQAITNLEQKYLKPSVAAVRSGDTVRVHQVIKEGAKSRVQVFEGVIIRTHRLGSLSANLTVRRVASGVGVEKTFLLHSPNIQKVEVLRRSKVRRNFLSYLRERKGKSARLQEVSFDKASVNAGPPPKVVADLTTEAEIAEITSTDGEIADLALQSTDDVAKDETAEASQADAAADVDSASDEGLLPAAEIAQGIDKADTEASK